MRGFWIAVPLLIVAGVGCDRIQQATNPHPQQVDYFAKKQACVELADRRRVRDEREMAKQPGGAAGFVEARSEQCYVPSLGTCIYESGLTDIKSDKSTLTVEDLMTGRDLVAGIADDPAYKRERERLFALCAK